MTKEANDIMIQMRQGVRGVVCPFCKAQSGIYCQNLEGKTIATSHAARWQAYREKISGAHESLEIVCHSVRSRKRNASNNTQERNK